jgi:hypothetical protein
MGSADTIDEAIPLQLSWTHKHIGSTSSGTESFEIRASGAGRKL